MSVEAQGRTAAAEQRIWGLPRRAVLGAGLAYLALVAAVWVVVVLDAREDDELGSDSGTAVLQAPTPVTAPPSLAAPHPVSGDRVSAQAVGDAVARAAGVSGNASAVCVPLRSSGIGLWTCTYRDPLAGSTRPARLEVGEDGVYSGVITDRRGSERPFGELCCVEVRP